MGSIGRNGRNSDGARHAEHVPEVRARPHQDVLDDVAEACAAPRARPSRSTARSCSSRMRSAASFATSTAPVDRDADVGGVQRGRVVDAVARGNRRRACARLSARMIRFFCAGLTRQNSVVSSTRAPSAWSSIVRSSAPVRTPSDRQAELAGKRARRPARCRPSRPSRRCRARPGCAAPRAALSFGRIVEGREARRTPARPRHSRDVSCSRGLWLRGDAEHPEPLASERLETCRQARPHARRRAAGLSAPSRSSTESRRSPRTRP